MKPKLNVKHFATQQPYLSTWQAMQNFTEQRTLDTPDELWLLEHEPVFTQGLAGKPEHVLNPKDIPVVQTDRGGQVTYHGPGQLMAYTLIDIKRKKLGIRCLVMQLEQTIIELLKQYGINANGDRDAPGVYVDGAKICSIGMRVRRGCTYHGLALNMDMDLSPFQQINPCGFKNLSVCQLKDFVPNVESKTVRDDFITAFTEELGYVSQR